MVTSLSGLKEYPTLVVQSIAAILFRGRNEFGHQDLLYVFVLGGSNSSAPAMSTVMVATSLLSPSGALWMSLLLRVLTFATLSRC